MKHINNITLPFVLAFMSVSTLCKAQTIGFGNQRLNLHLSNAAYIAFPATPNGFNPNTITPRTDITASIITKPHGNGQAIKTNSPGGLVIKSARRFNITSQSIPVILKSNLPSDRYDARQIIYLYEVLYTASEE